MAPTDPFVTKKLDPLWVKRSMIGGVLGLLGSLLGWVVVGNLLR